MPQGTAQKLLNAFILRQRLHTQRNAVLARHRRIVTLKTVLIAVTAAVALLGAALIAVPSSEQGANLCLGLSKCLSY